MRHAAPHRPRRVLAVALLALALTGAATRPVGGTTAVHARLDGVTVVTGTVRDRAGTPVAGAEVSRTGTTLHRVTGSDGRFAIPLPRTADVEPATLTVRCTGYEPEEVRVILRGDSVHLDVRLARSASPQAAIAAATSGELRSNAGRAEASRADAPRDLRAQIGGMPAAKSARRVPMAMSPVASMDPSRIRRAREPANTEAYEHITENEFHSPRVAALSTFSVDVDRASYANVRRFLSRGSLPPADAVRIEELVNYFPYDDPTPRAGDPPLRISTEVAPAPWNARHDLVRIALRARDVDMRRAPANNLVFLVDVSGSMNSPERLPLVKQSLALLVEQMREQDRVAIVVYAGRAGLVLPSTSGEEKQRILAALDRLEAGGSTAGGAGLRLAYDVAAQNFIRGGNNRVILCTDGDFNVGASSDGELVRLIEQRRDEGSYLTILGYGMGNYKDAKMEKLSGAGNGNYGYVDDLMEARKLLVKEMGGTLVTVAKDVKLQVEFNPERVQAYRLLGYEDRMLHDEDFANDAKDAGDVGAGHTVTALYEIVRAGVPLDVSLPGVAPLRYQQPASSARSDELLHVAMRYKQPDGGRSELVTHPVHASRHGERPSESMRFASAVAGFGMLLRHSPNAGTFGWRDVISLANGALGDDEDGYRAEFVRMAETAAQLSGGLALERPDREIGPVRDYVVPQYPPPDRVIPRPR